jgi:hypothetical protein
MTVFSKNASCPASEKLLAFQRGDAPERERDKITVHLRFCEFCAAEVDLYSHFPQSEENVEGADIPAPLFELAEALLNKRRTESLERLLTLAD